MSPKNAVIYIDYENIFETLNRYGVDPLEINFFPFMEKIRGGKRPGYPGRVY